MAKTKNRRHKIIVDKKFQFGISLKIIACLAIYLVIFCLMAVSSPFLVLLSGKASGEAMEAASTEIVVFVGHLLLPLGLTFACLALHCILLSHKIAGPVYRFNRTFEAMRDGDLSIDVRLRSGDYLRDLEAAYNEMIASLRGGVAKVKDEARELLAKARAALEEAPGGDRAGAEEVVRRGEALCGLLDGFRLSPEEREAQEGGEPAVEPAETPVGARES